MKTEQVQLSVSSQATLKLVTQICIFILLSDAEIIEDPIEYIVRIRCANDQSKAV